jgi:hypothetical protein
MFYIKEVYLDFPFPTDSDDHCETPREAYEVIVPLLNKLKTKNTCIYDPYFCDGAVKKNLTALGFDNVYNKKEDCYNAWKNNSTPPFDVLVTNPPYSADHIEKLIKFVSSTSKPWFLLMPNWVVKKDYYQAATATIRPLYLVPHQRYVYLPPNNFRPAKKSDVHKKSSPFVSMWYVYGGDNTDVEQLVRAFYQSTASEVCDLARSKSALRDLRRKKR